MATTLLENVNVETDHGRDLDMVHIMDPVNWGYALCAIKLTREALDWHEPAECIVCEDLWKQRYE